MQVFEMNDIRILASANRIVKTQLTKNTCLFHSMEVLKSIQAPKIKRYMLFKKQQCYTPSMATQSLSITLLPSSLSLVLLVQLPQQHAFSSALSAYNGYTLVQTQSKPKNNKG